MELSYDIQRTGNIISLLIPARKYKIFYAITKEEVLPAIEDFSCRLLLILENISFDSLADFFGLTARETEILVNTLLQKKLAVLNEVVCDVEYQEDGNSHIMYKQYMKCPKSFAFWRKICIS